MSKKVIGNVKQILNLNKLHFSEDNKNKADIKWHNVYKRNTYSQSYPDEKTANKNQKKGRLRLIKVMTFDTSMFISVFKKD
tara:strand:- start:268 stop:510 length:243 start_codon:yes stop_codon:yes gene_type:complete